VSQRLSEIDVGRINVVDEDGTLRMAICSKGQLPKPVVGGRELERSGPSPPGIVFYNDEGDECGGLVFNGRRTDEGGHEAGFHLSFDQFGNDQVLVLSYQDDADARMYGLSIYDRPESFPADEVEKLQSMPDGPEKASLQQELREAGAFGTPRMFVGRSMNGQPMIVLCDSKGRPRLRLSVAPDDSPDLEVVDEHGDVAYSLSSVARLQEDLTGLQRQVKRLEEELARHKRQGGQ